MEDKFIDIEGVEMVFHTKKVYSTRCVRST
jgi:hypothetical protein